MSIKKKPVHLQIFEGLVRGGMSPQAAQSLLLRYGFRMRDQAFLEGYRAIMTATKRLSPGPSHDAMVIGFERSAELLMSKRSDNRYTEEEDG